jgi:outer membrane receptor protein involved in Fe transport
LQPEDSLTLSVNVGRSFRYPEFSELYYPAQGFVRGNPGLESEYADYANLGVALRGKRGDIALDAFWREQHDTIKFLPVSAQSIRPMNTGETRARGLEATTRLRLSEHLSASASYALTDAEYKRSGFDFTQTPRHRFYGAVAYDDGGWNAEVSHFRESQQSADLFGSIRVPGKALWNLSLARRTRGERRGKLKVTVRNVFDQSARDFWDLPLPGRSIEVSWERTF